MEAPRLADLPISVLLCEPEESLRATLRDWLVDGGYSVSEGAAGAQPPDVVLFGLGPDPVADLRSLATILTAAPHAHALVLHRPGQGRVVLEALRAGAWGDLCREGLHAGQLASAVTEAARGEALISPRIAGMLLDAVQERRRGTGRAARG